MVMFILMNLLVYADAIHKLFDADLVMMSPRTMSSIGMAGFPRRRLIQAMGDPAVQGATPVHWNLLLWRNPVSGKTRSILALGFEPADPLFLDPELSDKARSSPRRAGCCSMSAPGRSSDRSPSGTSKAARWKPKWPAPGCGCRGW